MRVPSLPARTRAQLFVLVLAGGLILSSLPGPRSTVYALGREWGRLRTEMAVRSFDTLEGRHFIIRYLPEDADVAPLVLETAEAAYEPVTSDLGYEPPGRVTVVIYPEVEDLLRSFGWSDKDPALGVYWSGVIRVLSPRAMTDSGDPRERTRVFRQTGPMVHELTHLILDYRTGGNYPHWFSEGLAQFEEYRLMEYLWIEPESSLDQPLYSLKELQDGFDSLPNQALAYRQAFLLIDFLVQTRGPAVLSTLIESLSEGASFRRAAGAATGLDLAELEEAWLAWLKRGDAPGAGE